SFIPFLNPSSLKEYPSISLHYFLLSYEHSTILSEDYYSYNLLPFWLFYAMASPSELSLDCKPNSHSLLLKSFSDQITTSSAATAPRDDQKQKLEEFLSRLEEERFKIDAFKRELPLCMQLLTNAMESSRQQLQAYRGSRQPAVLEEFIPMKNDTVPPPSSSSDQIVTENKGCNNNNIGLSSDNKANWMTTAQLWSQDTKPLHNDQLPNLMPQKDRTFHQDNNNSTMGFNVISPTKQRNCNNGSGAFLPFSKERNSNCTLALAASTENSNKDHHDEEEEKIKCSEPAVNIINGFSSENNATASAVAIGGSNSSSQRKARRCWSPDLHRRFVNALQMLGGSQVATPKQIRELMKVDGLTNDEVKSHLQVTFLFSFKR
ncbi:Myb family transcription factor EFM, partial [Linum grandiflorum]